MKVHITEFAVKGIKVPKNKKYLRIYDTEQTGFAVLKTHKGSMSYILTYRDAEGVQRQEKLGEVGGMAAQAARTVAKSRLQDIQQNMEVNTLRKRRSMAPVMDDFFRNVYMPEIKVANRSAHGSESYYRNHVQAAFGHRRMDEVSVDDMREFYASLKNKEVAGGRWAAKAGEKLSEGSVKRIMILVRHIYNVAIRDQRNVVKENPTAGIRLVTQRKIKGKFLTAAQLRALVEAARESGNPDLAEIIKTLAGTGLRRENVLAMRWKWLDLEQGTLCVPAEADKAKHGFTLYLSSGVLELLRARRVASSGGEWVFANPATGKPYYSCRAAWVKTCERAGLTGVRMHDLRHTFASLMLDSGADIVDVQRQLAHTQIKTTAVYLHLREDRKREKANAAEQASGIFM